MRSLLFYFSFWQYSFVNELPGMKVYITEEKELIMEPSLKWAGNTNVLVVVKAYGLKLTVQVIRVLSTWYSTNSIMANVFHILCGEILRNQSSTAIHLVNLFNSCNFSDGWFAIFCYSTYYLKTIGSQLSMFCKNPSYPHGKGVQKDKLICFMPIVHYSRHS